MQRRLREARQTDRRTPYSCIKRRCYLSVGIDYMRDVWYSTSYLLDRKQSMNGCAKKRFENYKMQPVEFAFMPDFKGKFSQYGINPDRRTPSGIRAAIIREKGTNGEREMAYSLYLAGFDVKDVTMTDLISGRETLEDVNMIVYCGGFSNSDVLGSAKGCRCFPLQSESKRSARQILCTRGYAFTGCLQRLPAHDGT